jgi:hypothetical protein
MSEELKKASADVDDRAAFEVRYRLHILARDPISGAYFDSELRCLWDGWQALAQSATGDEVNWKAVAGEQRTVTDGLQAQLDKLVAERDTMIAGNGFWCDGAPPHPYGKEWFIATLKNGNKSVLRELPEDHSYDYKTADDTYYTKDWVIRWAQFPDSDFLLYATALTHSTAPALTGVPVYQLQCREIGEGDWCPCDYRHYTYCQKSPEMDTRIVEVAPDHSASRDGIVIPRPLADRIFEIIAGEGFHEEGELADIIDTSPSPEPDHKEMVSVPRKLLIRHLDEIGRYAWPENTDEQLRALLAGGDQ